MSTLQEELLKELPEFEKKTQQKRFLRVQSIF